MVNSPCPGRTPLLPHRQAGTVSIAGHQAHPGQFLPVNPPQRLAIHGKGYPALGVRRQMFPAPLGQRRLESRHVHPPKYPMQAGYRRGFGVGEAQGGHGGFILATPPLVDGVEAAGAGEHGAHGQGQNGGQGMATPGAGTKIRDGGEGLLQTFTNFQRIHTLDYNPPLRE